MDRSAPKFDTSFSDDSAALLCPSCGGIYSHHGRVEVYDRVDDAQEGTHTVVDPDETVHVTRDMEGNPSYRRQGLAVSLQCEECSQHFQLTIAQSKGNTYLQILTNYEDGDES